MSTWKDFVTAALLGSERAAAPPLPGLLAGAVGQTSELPAESRFLLDAGAMALWRRAGLKPSGSSTGLSAAETETNPPVGQACLAHLRIMLGGRFSHVLWEWLTAVAAASRYVPPEFLPSLLAKAKQNAGLRPLIIAAGGKRAHWLAAQNPQWHFAAADSDDNWETGSREQRIRMLQTWRHREPSTAREKLAAVWKEEPADVRAEFLSILLTNLSTDDISFLEATLDDRSKEVRRWAVDLLARLSDSEFVRRMVERAAPILAWNRGGLLSRVSLEVTLPSDPDAAGKRDGLDAKVFGTQKVLGEKAVLLVQILSAVPLSHWTESSGQSPAALLKTAGKSEFGRAIATGWAWATQRQRDAEWAEAILDGEIQPHFELLSPQPLTAVLPEAKRAERFAAAIRAGALKASDISAWQSFASQLTWFSTPWPPALTRAILDALRSGATHGIPWQQRGSYESLLLRVPPALLSEAVWGWPANQDGVPEMIELLQFRHEALTALSQS